MSINMILFDLDGTLLPMDNDEFTRGYFGLLAKKLAPRGYEKDSLIDAIWAGVAAMVKNDGSRRNEEAFWDRFTALCGEQVLEDKPLFEEFYAVEFCGAKVFCGFNPKAAEVVELVKSLGLRTALATNPLFPSVATEHRIGWAGLKPGDFELYTTYENSSYCKPNPDYYRDVAARLGVDCSECLMVGNDAAEDMQAAQSAGMSAFLLTDCLINRRDLPVDCPHGGFDELAAYLKTLRS